MTGVRAGLAVVLAAWVAGAAQPDDGRPAATPGRTDTAAADTTLDSARAAVLRDSILAAPIVLDLALFLDMAQRAKMRGIQEWLSFYFKSPIHARGLYAEHDLFIQLMKLKNTLRDMRGEELIHHLGSEYYD